MEKIWGEFLPYSLLIQSTVGLIEVSQNFITFPDKLHVLTGVGAGGGGLWGVWGLWGVRIA